MELYECHGHLMLDGSDYAAARRRHENGPDDGAVRGALSALRDAGVTWYRDGGDPLGVSLRGRELAAEYGIRCVTPVFAIYKKGLYGSILGRPYESLADYLALLGEVRAAGGDFVKLVVSGIITFRQYGQLSCESLPAGEIRELIRIAHEEGFAVMTHVNGPEAVRAVAEAGGESVEHGYFSDRACLEAMAAAGTVWVPTLAAVEAFLSRPGTDAAVAAETLARQKDALRTAAAMGVAVASGSDSGAAGVPHGFGAIRERELLEWAGVLPERQLSGNRLLAEKFQRS